MLRILTYVPLAPSRPKIFARTISTIFNLEWDEPIEIVFGRCDVPRGKHYQDLRIKHEEARKLALDGDYDALFLVENDMVLPPDALKRLVDMRTDVAYALYCSRHGMRQWLAFLSLYSNSGKSISDSKEYVDEYWDKEVVTQGAGLGCTLIWRHVLESIPFRDHEHPLMADDWSFSQDCIKHGFIQTHNLGVRAGHIFSTPEESGIVWPDKDALYFNKVELFGESSFNQPAQKVEINVGSFGIRNINGKVITNETRST